MMMRTKRVVLPGTTIYYVECTMIPPDVPTIVRLPGREKPKTKAKRRPRSRKAA